MTTLLPAAVPPIDAPGAAGELRSGAELELPGGGTLAWLVPAGMSAQWQLHPTVWRLPGAPPHLRGVTYWLGRLTPVFDVALWLAPEQQAGECEHILSLALPTGPAALRVRGAPDLVHLDAAPAAEAEARVPTPLQRFLKPRVRLDGTVVHEFEIEPWLKRARASAEEPARAALEHTP